VRMCTLASAQLTSEPFIQIFGVGVIGISAFFQA
jgi:hypothetical protein